MRKLISLSLLLVLVWALIVTANASGIDVSASTDHIDPGETVVVTVALEGEIPAERGVTVLQGILTYNSAVLELKNVEKVSKDLTDAAKHTGEDKAIFHYLSMDSTPKSFAKGTLVTLTFQAKQEITVDHTACDIHIRISAQNAQGQAVAELELTDQIALVIDAAHTWDEGIVTKAPTCVEAGEKTYRCTMESCAATKTERIDATGQHLWKEATYTVPRTCETCGTTDGAALGLPKPVVQVITDPATGGGILTWNDDGEADSYKVYRATTKKGKYTLLTTVTEPKAAVSVSVGKTYYYKVVAVCGSNSKLNSGYSAVVSVTGKCAQPVAKAQLNTSGKPVLSWSKVSGAKKYEVYRSANGGAEKKIGTITKTSYTDTKAVVGVTYTYRVRAIGAKSAYNGAYSAPVTIRAICAQPALTIKIDAATGKPNLTWKSVTGAACYEIRRGESVDGPYTVLEDLQYDLEYFDATAQPDRDYWYQVVALAREEVLNNAATVKTHTTLAKPAVTGDLGDKKPVITWEPVEGASRYYVYRSTKKTGGFKKVATVAGQSYTDTKASKGKTYYYKVAAVTNAGTTGAYSDTVKIKSK